MSTWVNRPSDSRKLGTRLRNFAISSSPSFNFFLSRPTSPTSLALFLCSPLGRSLSALHPLPLPPPPLASWVSGGCGSGAGDILARRESWWCLSVWLLLTTTLPLKDHRLGDLKHFRNWQTSWLYRATLHCSGAVFLLKYFNSLKIFPDFLVGWYYIFLHPPPPDWRLGGRLVLCESQEVRGTQRTGWEPGGEGGREGGGKRGGESMKPAGSQENSQATVWYYSEKEDFYFNLAFSFLG